MCAVCVHLVGVCICLGARVHMCMWCVHVWLCVHVRDIYVHVGCMCMCGCVHVSWRAQVNICA